MQRERVVAGAAYLVPTVAPANLPRCVRDVAAVESALGQERLETLWKAGCAMTAEEAFACALGGKPAIGDVLQRS